MLRTGGLAGAKQLCVVQGFPASNADTAPGPGRALYTPRGILSPRATARSLLVQYVIILFFSNEQVLRRCVSRSRASNSSSGSRSSLRARVGKGDKKPPPPRSSSPSFLSPPLLFAFPPPVPAPFAVMSAPARTCWQWWGKRSSDGGGRSVERRQPLRGVGTALAAAAAAASGGTSVRGVSSAPSGGSPADQAGSPAEPKEGTPLFLSRGRLA